MNLKFIAAGVLALATVGANAQNLNGAGATFPYPIYSKWFSEYKQQNSSVQINYQAIGSGGGIRQVTEGTVDFGASDVTMTDEQLAAAKIKVIALPTVLGAVVPVYNVPGVNKDLNFSGDVIAEGRARNRQGTERGDPASDAADSHYFGPELLDHVPHRFIGRDVRSIGRLHQH